MKLLKTITRIVLESQEAYELACEKGVNEKELERLEKNYNESLKLMRLYEGIGKKETEKSLKK
jgi:hypothetical protein